MVATKLDIFNMALAHLRQRPVADDVSQTPEGNACRRFYDQALASSFRAGDWPFARTYLPGVKLPGVTLPNWRFAYAYPAGISAVHGIALQDGIDNDPRYRAMLVNYNGAIQQAVFANVDNAVLICTATGVGAPLYPPEFVELLTYWLAALMAIPLTGKAELMLGMRKLADAAVERAAGLSNVTDSRNEGESDGRAAPLVESSPVDLANRALQALGLEPITSFGMRSVAADTVRRFYLNCLRATLRAVDWNFARRYVALQPRGLSMVPGCFYAYTLPASCAAVRGLALTRKLDPRIKFTLADDGGGRGRELHTGRAPITLVYTADDVPVSQYDPQFVALFTALLAQDLAVPLGKPNLLQPMAALARGAIALAAADNFNEETQDLDDEVPDWLAARGVPSLTREERGISERIYDFAEQQAGLYALPGGQAANPQPAMITQLAEQIRPAYIPGLTAPPEPDQPILGSGDWTVEATGGRIEADGRHVVDDPSVERPLVNRDDEDEPWGT